MNLLEKAREYQKKVNMAMADYEEAKKAYDEMQNVESCFYVKVNNTNMDLHEWNESIKDLTDGIVQSFTTRRRNALEASEKRLAVLIGDKELFTPQDSVIGTQSHGNRKEDEHTIKEEHGLENDSNDILNSKELLYKEYVTNDMTVPQIIEKYKVGKYDVVNALNKFGIKKGKRKSTPSNTNKR